MKRSEFIAGVAAGAFAASSASAMTDEGPFAGPEPYIERSQAGKPHAGKVLAAIQPHADDLPIFAGGLLFKLIREGYTGYLIRTTNDDHTGPGTVGEGVLANERDNLAVTKAFGLKKAYDLYYRNHSWMRCPARAATPSDLSFPATKGRHGYLLRPVGSL